jgi:hypothetical protein
METEKIDLLKKITLSVEAGTAPDSTDLNTQSSQIEFIYVGLWERRFSSS